MDVTAAVELLQRDGKKQFEHTTQVLTEAAKSIGKAMSEVSDTLEFVQRMHFRVDEILEELTRRQALLIASQAAEEEEEEKSNSIGVAEIIILSCAVMWFCLVISVFRRWARYNIWDKSYLQRCCKNPEFLKKLNFPLKACGCMRWKYCQCIDNNIPPIERAEVCSSSDERTTSGDGFVTPGVNKDTVYKDL